MAVFWKRFWTETQAANEPRISDNFTNPEISALLSTQTFSEIATFLKWFWEECRARSEFHTDEEIVSRKIGGFFARKTSTEIQQSFPKSAATDFFTHSPRARHAHTVDAYAHTRRIFAHDTRLCPPRVCNAETYVSLGIRSPNRRVLLYGV